MGFPGLSRPFNRSFQQASDRLAESPDSDVDLMVEIEPSSRIDLHDYVGIIHSLQDLFDVGVDVANREGLKDYVRPSAERDAIYAF